MGKIERGDTMMDILVKLSDGVVGAAVVLADLLKTQPAFGDVALLHFDELGIYGSDIWILFKDCCNSDIRKVAEVISRYMAFEIAPEEIRTAIRELRPIN